VFASRHGVRDRVTSECNKNNGMVMQAQHSSAERNKVAARAEAAAWGMK
jgi:hypothetical protein